MGLESIINNLIKVGKIESYNAEKATCRVIFEESELKSFDLPILVKQSLKNKDYWIPDKDEMVLCVFLPTGIESGFVLGAIYNKVDTTPISNPNIRHISFEDGTVIEYDRENHKLTANVQGEIDVQATGNITVKSDTNIKLEAPAVAINTNSLSMQSMGGGASAMSINGNVTVSGTTTTGGINLNTHKHPESIGSITGEPQ